MVIVLLLPLLERLLQERTADDVAVLRNKDCPGVTTTNAEEGARQSATAHAAMTGLFMLLVLLYAVLVLQSLCTHSYGSTANIRFLAGSWG